MFPSRPILWNGRTCPVVPLFRAKDDSCMPGSLQGILRNSGTMMDLTVVKENEQPIYESCPWSRSRGQKYRVYRNRMRLRPHALFTMFGIPVRRIRSVRVGPLGFLRTLSGVLHGVQPTFSMLSVAIMDKTFSRRHVLIQRNRGLVSCFRFTPDDPKGFAAARERDGVPVKA